MIDASLISEALSDPASEPMLFYSPGACSLASHIALEEAGKPYRPIETLLSKGQQTTPEYLAVNPRGRVPALIAEGRVITENTAILHYIGLSNPEAGLYPADLLDQAACIAQMAWFSNTPHIHQKAKFRPYHFLDDEACHEPLRAKAKANYWKAMEEIDELIADKRWIMGDRYTLVDPYALVFYSWGVSNEMPMDRLKDFTRHKDQMLARPAVRIVVEREKNPHLR